MYGWHRTGACYTDKLTFSHSSSIKVWDAYYTNVRIIFEFLRYSHLTNVNFDQLRHITICDTIWHTGLHSGASAMESPVPGPHVGRCQLLVQADEWTSSGLCSGSNSFHLVYQQPPATLSRKFIYADDICCAFQAETFSDIECTLTADLAHFAKYCQQWHLKPSRSKNVTSVFHLHISGHVVNGMFR